MKKLLKCFISAPSYTDTSILTKILSQKGIETYDAFSIRIGDTIKSALVTKIREADFVVVVIPENNPNVFYELGICEGMGKPSFLIVEKDIQAPYFIQQHLYLRANINDEELITISLNKFIDDILSNKYKRSTKLKHKKINRTINSQIEKYISKIKSLRTTHCPIKVESIVEEIFNTLNVQVVSNHPKFQDKGVDFAVWVDNIGEMIGNPLFIEIKYGALTPQRIHQTENQIREYLIKSDAKACILLYLDTEGKRFIDNYCINPLILRFDLEDFVQEISLSSFEETLINKRNNMVHGIQK